MTRVFARWQSLVGIAMLACLVPIHAQAQSIHRFELLLDTDNVAATGCTAVAPGGSIAGIEQRFTTVVTTSVTGATVTRIERQVCANGTFGSPLIVDATGWNAGIGNGVSGTAAIESYVPRSALPGSGTMRAIVISTNATGGQDRSPAFFVSLDATPEPTLAVPMSPWLAALIAIAVALIAWRWSPLRPVTRAAAMIVIVGCASGLVWAATVLLDGNVGDWAGVSPAVTMPKGDAPVNADLVAIFVQADATRLYFRVDADVRGESPVNQPPIVNAGPNQTITQPASATLAGTATDDGLPNPPGALTILWTKVSGPGIATFANAASLSTTVSLGAVGTYVLRLTANDGALAASADVTITLNPPVAGNQPPVVSAGANQTITLPASATLTGNATDDGLPNPPGAMTLAWSKVSGPGTVTFSAPSTATSNATFDAAGTYVLRLTANDSALTAGANVTITVNPSSSGNQPPVVSAGANQTITLPASANLAGSATDDGLPNPPGTLANIWTLESGPGTGVAFGNASALATTATFQAAGIYVLRLSAHDGALSASSTVQITVIDGPPQLAAIADRTIALGARFQLVLQGTDSNFNDTLTYALTSAPAGATLNPAPLIDWMPTAAQVGVNTFTATVTDAAGHTASATFHVTVVHVNQAPVLSPQADATLPVGTPFARTLTATDPDAGDVLTFAMVSGPVGMTLAGANLNWPTAGQSPGDYPVTVRVVDAGGLVSLRSFTVTLLPAAAPVANNDSYEVKLGTTLVVAPAGVLANDVAPYGVLAAQNLTDPGKGVLSLFNADGSFTYVAPPILPAAPLQPIVKYKLDVPLGIWQMHPLVADVDGDGIPEIIVNAHIPGGLGGGLAVYQIRGGALQLLWTGDGTHEAPYADCYGPQFSHSGRPVLVAVGDIDDSGEVSIVFPVWCSREAYALSEPPTARYMALRGRTGAVKWLSPPVADARVDPVTLAPLPDNDPAGVPDGLVNNTVPTIARLRAGESPSIVIGTDVLGSGIGPFAGRPKCAQLVPGWVGNTDCRGVFVLDGRDGTVRRRMAALGGLSTTTYFSQQAAVVADLEVSGSTNIVYGATVFNADGTVKLNGGNVRTWFNGLGNFDADPDIEIVRIDDPTFVGGPSRLAVLKADGTPLWSLPLSGHPRTGVPVIADVDGKGHPSIVLNVDRNLCAIDYRGTYQWCYDLGTQPDGRATIGEGIRVGVYDLDGDGVPEIIVPLYGEKLLFLDGASGKLKQLFDMAAVNGPPLATRYADVFGYPIIADVDGSGHASILVNWSGNVLETRMDIIGSATNDWRPARRIYHQFAYYPGAINDNGSIPPALVNSFATPATNVFGAQPQILAPVDPRLRTQTSFTYRATHGALASLPATVTIDILPPNRPPQFVSTPPTHWSGVIFASFDYAAHAIDPDVGDTIAYSLLVANGSSAGNCSINATSGAFHCTALSTGNYGFVIVATDSLGEKAYQTINLAASTGTANIPDLVGQLLPAASASIAAAGFAVGNITQIVSPAPVGRVLSQAPVAGTSAFLGDLVALSVSQGPAPVIVPFVVGLPSQQAIDTLASVGLSSTMTVAPSATVPPNDVMAQSPAFGTSVIPSPANPVALTVSAGGALTGTVASIVVEPGPATRLVGDRLRYKATAVFTDGTSQNVTLLALWTSSGTGVATIDATGGAQAIGPGAATITAQVGTATGQSPLSVIAQAGIDSTLPIAAITSPADDADVLGQTSIVGTASDANFLRYELAVAPAGESAWKVIAEGTSGVTNGTLGTFDPATLLNDLYTVRLTVHDRGGNESVATTTVQVRGQRKVGLFTLGFEDLNVALAGIPITVTRTYDSRDKAKGDFGIGWRLGLQTIRLRTNRVLGTGWVRIAFGPTVTLQPTSPHKVSVTLPDGRVEEFDLVVSPTSNLGSLDFTTVTGFAARPGTLGKLEMLGNNSLLILNGGSEDELVDDITLDTYNPQLWRYTTFDGTRIEIHRTEGVKKVTDANGNAITFGPNGITHSGGQGVTFTRDVQDRIKSVTDLNGNVQTYAYDGNGDLVMHTDPAGGVSRYGYDRFHGLLEIHNALGTRVTRNDYDSSGRLIAITDANGRQITFTHNTGAQEDLITDRLGRVTRLVYDAQGNVTSQERQVTIEGVSVTAATTASYDAQGNETLQVDADGLRRATTYNALLPVTQIVDAGGLNLTSAFSYNVRNDLTGVTDPGGRTFTLTRDSNGNLTGASTPATGSVTLTTNAQGLPILSRDANGVTTSSTRDAIGRVTREETTDISSALLRRVDFGYDANGNVTSETLYRTIDGVPTPLTTIYVYDAANRVVSETDPLGSVSRTEYNATGQVVAQIDALGRRTDFTFDVQGRLVRTTYPDGTFETSTYDAEGSELTKTDRAGRTTTYAYDELKRRTRIALADGSSTQTIYSPGGRIAATIDANGNRTDYAYDTAGRATSTTLPAVVVGTAGGPAMRPHASKVLSALGGPVSVTDPSGRITSFQYDTSGRLTQTTFPDGQVAHQTFDAVGRRTSLTNEEGQTTTYAYDGLGRLVTVAGLDGDATYTYDEAGNLLTQVDALGRVTQFRYDALNRITRKTYPGGQTESAAYDAVGNIVSRTDGQGRTVTFTYDAMDRLQAKSLPGGTVISYAYMADGQRASVTEPRGTTTFAYDTRGRVASVTNSTGEALSYTRDANDNLVALASPAAVVNYGYDALNRLIQVNAPEGQGLAYFDLAGNRIRQTQANGIVSDTQFDMRNRPTVLSHKSGSGALLQSFVSAYSPSGRRIGTTESDGSVEAYTYDVKGRLASETRMGTNPFAITHVYDPAGNRIQRVRDGASTAFSYDINDQLLAAGGATFTWDDNGNFVSKTDGTGVTRYGYDAEDRLVSILGGGLSNQYAYDADGNRTEATTATGITRFVVDTQNNSGLSQVLEERDGANNLQARYSYGNHLLSMTRGANSSFYLRDASGGTRALTDSAATLTDRYQYDAYGNTVMASGSTVNSYRYRGERLDIDSGFYPLRARYYNPEQGRFLSRDPFAGDPATAISRHRYVYANDDPVDYIDPTGTVSLSELSVVQFITNTMKAFGAADVVAAGCKIKADIDVIGTMFMLSEIAVTGTYYAIVKRDPYNSNKKIAFSAFGHNPTKVSGASLKSLEVRIEEPFAITVNTTLANGASPANVSFSPKGWSVSGGANLEPALVEFRACGAVKVGGVNLKGRAKRSSTGKKVGYSFTLSAELNVLGFLRAEYLIADVPVRSIDVKHFFGRSLR